MAELETAVSFYLAVIDPENDDENCVARIEARDKAVALRVLDELIAIVNVFPLDTDEVRLARYRAAYSVLRAKYQEKP